jgi:hypothetical protein
MPRTAEAVWPIRAEIEHDASSMGEEIVNANEDEENEE